MKNKIWPTLKVNFIVIFLFTSFILASLFAPIWLYTTFVLALLYDYFVLLGGNLYWLNRIIDDKDFHGTGIYRRMLAVDAKMIIIAIVTGLWLLFVSESHLYVESCHNMHHLTLSGWINQIRIFGIDLSQGLPLFVYTFFIKMFMLGQLTHSIHHIIINEKLTGMKFSGYAPLTMGVQKLIKWSRR